MTLSASNPYRVVVSEMTPDGTIKERIAGDCSGYLIAITAEISGELRILTDHDGPVPQRRKALQSLTAHLRSAVGAGR